MKYLALIVPLSFLGFAGFMITKNQKRWGWLVLLAALTFGGALNFIRDPSKPNTP